MSGATAHFGNMWSKQREKACYCVNLRLITDKHPVNYHLKKLKLTKYLTIQEQLEKTHFLQSHCQCDTFEDAFSTN